MTELLLVVTRIGDDEPSAKVTAYDAATVGREFKRGLIGYSFTSSYHAFVTRFACECWEDVTLFLTDEGHLHHFQAWIDGRLDRVAPPDGTELPTATEGH
jgi:hypothetical protein